MYWQICLSEESHKIFFWKSKRYEVRGENSPPARKWAKNKCEALVTTGASAVHQSINRLNRKFLVIQSTNQTLQIQTILLFYVWIHPKTSLHQGISIEIKANVIWEERVACWRIFFLPFFKWWRILAPPLPRTLFSFSSSFQFPHSIIRVFLKNVFTGRW